MLESLCNTQLAVDHLDQVWVCVCICHRSRFITGDLTLFADSPWVCVPDFHHANITGKALLSISEYFRPTSCARRQHSPFTPPFHGTRDVEDFCPHIVTIADTSCVSATSYLIISSQKVTLKSILGGGLRWACATACGTHGKRRDREVDQWGEGPISRSLSMPEYLGNRRMKTAQAVMEINSTQKKNLSKTQANSLHSLPKSSSGSLSSLSLRRRSFLVPSLRGVPPPPPPSRCPSDSPTLRGPLAAGREFIFEVKCNISSSSTTPLPSTINFSVLHLA